MTKTPVFSIGTVADLLDVPTSTLRTWEDRYGLIVPERSSGGQRLYTREQVEQLRFVKASIDGGMQPGDAHRVLSDRLASGDVLTTPGPEAPHIAVLLAERDPFAAGLTDFFLRTEGYRVLVALSADEAMATFVQEKPELVVVDLLLSDGAGYELCRRASEWGQARIIAISSLDTRDRALDAGADVFLQKPLDPIQLISVVRDMLGSSAVTAHRPLK
ncbi:MAG TPA: MerR family transcriptional regulator [Acidimicrobiia bacterium]|nr:MerR family transcriptional regulator [Acidimicrobiia bacterium]